MDNSPQVAPIQTTTPVSKKSPLFVGLTTLVLFLLIVVGFLAYQNWNLQRQISLLQIKVIPKITPISTLTPTLTVTLTPTPISTLTPTPTPTSSIPTGWKAHPFSSYGLTMYAPSNWKSNSQDFPNVPSSLIRFWQGTSSATSTIQLDIKTSWANTGDAPYQPKNYTVAGDIAAVRVDPPQKNTTTLDRYQTNVYFENKGKTYVFSCVHNWISEQVQICNTMLDTLTFNK